MHAGVKVPPFLRMRQLLITFSFLIGCLSSLAGPTDSMDAAEVALAAADSLIGYEQQQGDVGKEALARWQDPQFGFLSPADFIETLEEYHLIHKLDMFVVERVCKDIQDAKEKFRLIIPTSLNFSRLDFDSLNLAQEVSDCLKKYNIDKNEIHIEITESTLSEDDEKLKEELKSFRSHGYALWLDDFGSGFSGLNVLKEYDFDLLKIDMKFLSNFDVNKKSRQILKNVINLAKNLGMQTLTEGVETKEQYDFLRENGCEKLQGYFFSKPVSRLELEARMDDGTFKID